MADPTRIAIFTHDTFGLGHVQRCHRIAWAVAQQDPDAALLFITGNPALHVFPQLPRNADYLKIPTVVKTGSQESQPPHLPLPTKEIIHIRQEVIAGALREFRPNAFLVDNFPTGSGKELIPALKEVRATSCRTILGLRDILDSPEAVRADWEKNGTYQVLEQYYDSILVYGMPDVFDLAEAYQLPPHLAAKVSYGGYVTDVNPPKRTPEEVKQELDISSGFVLATVGGGGDGFPLLEVFLKAVVKLPSDLAAVVITGPLMGAPEREKLRQLAGNRPGVVLLDYVTDMASYLAAADLVVTMGGYNTTAEILALRPRTIIVPRTWRYGEHQIREDAGMEWEQLLRARALSRMGIADILEPEQLSASILSERILQSLANPRPQSSVQLDLGGVEHAAQHILSEARKGMEVEYAHR